MKDLKHLIYFENLLQEANNELVQRAISDGKKAIAYTCYHIPEVLLNVDNCFSVRLRAPRTGSMDIATYYLSSYLCGYSKALLERGIEGGYNFLSALIGSESCSTMNSSYIDRRFNLPSHVVNVPLRYTEEEVQKYAVDEVKSCIRFIEEQTGEKFDWDAYFSAMKIYNKQLEYELQKWDVNKTDYPQMTGATFWLYRLFYFHLSGGIDKIFIKTDKKVNKLMMKGYERKEHVSKEMRHRAIVWSCPANYYTSLANWLENCWGINVVMDMETMISYIMYDTEDKERSLATYAKTLQRTTMRKHTKGGYQNVLDELWRICDEYNADTVIMYNQISCKGMDGLNGIFDDQARERNINFIWVDQDLMDPRTVSRRDMREQINKYMTTVLQEEPVDPTLVDFDDTMAW